ARHGPTDGAGAMRRGNREGPGAQAREPQLPEVAADRLEDPAAGGRDGGERREEAEDQCAAQGGQEYPRLHIVAALASLTARGSRRAEPGSAARSLRWPRSVGRPVLTHCDVLRRLPAKRQERESTALFVDSRRGGFQRQDGARARRREQALDRVGDRAPA